MKRNISFILFFLLKSKKKSEYIQIVHLFYASERDII